MNPDVLTEATGQGDVLEIPRRFQSYEVIRTMAIGGFAVVVEVKDISTSERFAAKVVRRPESNSQEMRLLERELRLSETISCPHLVSVIEVVYLDELIVLIMEYGVGTDLMTFTLDNPDDVTANWQKIFKQVCLGVKYLHNKGLAHRDVKLANVLIDESYNCKLCDYGFMCESRNDTLSSTKCGTLMYASPEMIQRANYDAKAADVWSLGILLYFLFTGRTPWLSDGDAGLKEEINRGIVHTELLTANVREIVLRCCNVNPETRVKIDDVLDMAVFQAIPRNPMNAVRRMRERKDNRSLPHVNTRGSIRKIWSGSTFCIPESRLPAGSHLMPLRPGSHLVSTAQVPTNVGVQHGGGIPLSMGAHIPRGVRHARSTVLQLRLPFS